MVVDSQGTVPAQHIETNDRQARLARELLARRLQAR